MDNRIIDVLEDFLADTLVEFDAAPQQQWESFVWRLVDYGVGVLVGALTHDLPGAIAPEVLAKRERFFEEVAVLMDKAANYGLVDASLTPSELAAELIVVTRPMDPQLNALFPDVRERLVRHLLTAWRTRVSQPAQRA